MSKKKVITVRTADVGRYVRIFYNDIGAMDGIITEVNDPNDFQLLLLSDLKHGSTNNNTCPVLKLGAYVSAEHSGLNH